MAGHNTNIPVLQAASPGFSGGKESKPWLTLPDVSTRSTP